MGFSADLPLAERRAIAAARLEPIASALGLRVEHDDQTVAAVGAIAPAGRGYRVRVTLDDESPTWLGPAGNVVLRVDVDRGPGELCLRWVHSDEGDEVGDDLAPVRGSLYLCATTDRERAAMSALLARLPPAIVDEVEAFCAGTDAFGLDVDRGGVELGLAIWCADDDDEDAAEWVAACDGIAPALPALARLAAILERATPGREIVCAFCAGRFAITRDYTCPHCGAAVT